MSDASSMINYLPTKFAHSVRRRKGKGRDLGDPKPGGSVDAFRIGESRMPRANDQNYDGVEVGGGRGGRNLGGSCSVQTWWCVAIHGPQYSMLALAALIFMLTAWFDGFLAIYTFFLWISFALLVHSFILEGKINKQWSTGLGADGRLRIQNQLGRCGYFSPFVESPSNAGMIPKAYRFSETSMAAIMNSYASELAEHYGPDMAEDIMARSRSNLTIPPGYNRRDQIFCERPYNSGTVSINS
ncbi:hypothetical protein DFH07DRAFT_865798 [Mycena maculata]|uniref:Uncharacterized protein n=1 Tax=Mycena maculata TaxID=230809 RepID=A0AAD7NTW4_9AGAR|nr:hypothetical protein DFH07DRAFT_865798 [Mycena maculata]